MDDSPDLIDSLVESEREVFPLELLFGELDSLEDLDFVGYEGGEGEHLGSIKELAEGILADWVLLSVLVPEIGHVVSDRHDDTDKQKSRLTVF